MVLGNPHVDLSKYLEETTRFLLKSTALNIFIYIHRPNSQTKNRWIVVINLYFPNKTVKASGTDKNIVLAYIKGLSEIGEEILCNKHNLECRSGIAGGLQSKNALIRAQAELIERDSFFEHYRNMIPFLSKQKVSFCDSSNIYAFEMLAKEKNFKSYIVTDEDSIQGTSECLLFGTSSHPDKDVAIEKAYNEYVAISLNHKKFPDRCKHLEKNKETIEKLTDLHHIYSRDERNKQIFQKLCQVSKKKSSYSHKNLSWEIESLESPLKLFKYYRVISKNLIKIQFGKPEHFSFTLNQLPLYHPFW